MTHDEARTTAIEPWMATLRQGFSPAQCRVIQLALEGVYTRGTADALERVGRPQTQTVVA